MSRLGCGSPGVTERNYNDGKQPREGHSLSTVLDSNPLNRHESSQSIDRGSHHSRGRSGGDDTSHAGRTNNLHLCTLAARSANTPLHRAGFLRAIHGLREESGGCFLGVYRLRRSSLRQVLSHISAKPTVNQHPPWAVTTHGWMDGFYSARRH